MWKREKREGCWSSFGRFDLKEYCHRLTPQNHHQQKRKRKRKILGGSLFAVVVVVVVVVVVEIGWYFEQERKDSLNFH